MPDLPTTAAAWAWLAFALFGPLPLVWMFRLWKLRRDRKRAEAVMAYRREKFGGFISTTEGGKRVSKPLDRPPSTI